MSFMLDTNICIYAMGRPTGRLAERMDKHASELCLSSISVAELAYGAENSSRPEDNLRALTDFLGALEILDFGIPAADHFGSIRAHLRRAGTPIGPYDLLIGAHARSLNMTLVTNNRREFDRIPRLKVENWTE